MNPIDWLQKANQMRETYTRYPHADPTALRVFGQQAQGFMDDQEQQNQLYPGRVAGGSGPTGLGSQDAGGYANMLESQQAMAGLKNFMGGKSGPDISFQGGPDPQGFAPATGLNMGRLPGYGAPDDSNKIPQTHAGPFNVAGAYQPHEEWMNRNPAAQAYRKSQV